MVAVVRPATATGEFVLARSGGWAAEGELLSHATAALIDASRVRRSCFGTGAVSVLRRCGFRPSDCRDAEPPDTDAIAQQRTAMCGHQRLSRCARPAQSGRRLVPETRR